MDIAPRAEKRKSQVAGTPVFDSRVFEELKSLDPDSSEALCSQLVAAYDESSREYLSTLRRAMDAGDGEAAARAAHPLKSSSAQLGGMLAASLAKEIESLARNGDLEALPPLADSLEVAIEDLMEALAAADFGASDA